MNIEVEIKNLKNIKKFKYEFPLESGIYAIAGENGSSKSTIMNAVASVIKPTNLAYLKQPHINSDTIIKLSANGLTNEWVYKTNNLNEKYTKVIYDNGKKKILHPLNFNGFYEGSIFSGTRFQDIQNFNKMLQTIKTTDLEKASPQITNQLSYILHGDKEHYGNLYQLRDDKKQFDYLVLSKPYFLVVGDGQIVGKYDMSSGECMLITLLNFIFNTVINKNKRKEQILFFIDEVELALHPAAIKRLIEYLNDFVSSHGITVYFSTHSPDILKRLNPNNIFYIKNIFGEIYVENPTYPHYAIKNFYEHDGYDLIILTEDKVTQLIVKKLLAKFCSAKNILVNVVPVGGWANVLELQKNFLIGNVLGVNKYILSVIDGDVEDRVKKVKDYDNLMKLFLPIKCLEKYLFEKLISSYSYDFAKLLGDKYFRMRTLDDTIKGYKNKYEEKDRNGKNLYNFLLATLNEINIYQDYFIENIAEDIYVFENLNTFCEKIDSFIESKCRFGKKHKSRLLGFGKLSVFAWHFSPFPLFFIFVCVRNR
jgi:predicted ATPase